MTARDLIAFGLVHMAALLALCGGAVLAWSLIARRFLNRRDYE